MTKELEQEVRLQSLKTEDPKDKNLQNHLQSCRYFLFESEIGNARLKVCNYSVEILSMSSFNEKLDHVFRKLFPTAKMKLAFGFYQKTQ